MLRQIIRFLSWFILLYVDVHFCFFFLIVGQLITYIFFFLKNRPPPEISPLPLPAALPIPTCPAPSGSSPTILPSTLCAKSSNMPIGMMMAHVGRKPMEKAELLLSAARHLNETLEPERVYDRFHELLEDAVPHAGVVVSAFDPGTELISCEYAWVDGEKLDPAIFPALPLNRDGGGMQSRVITSGEALLVNDVPEQVKQQGGVYYDVDREGHMRKVPEEGPPGVRAAMMLPIKHEGEVVGVVQLMNADSEYDEEQFELAEGLVGLMGAAARNARLHEAGRAEAAARARAEATAAEREHAARVLDAVGDGVFLLDDEGLVRFWNRAAELVTQKAGDKVCGRPAADTFADWERIAGQIPVSLGAEAARPVTLTAD